MANFFKSIGRGIFGGIKKVGHYFYSRMFERKTVSEVVVNFIVLAIFCFFAFTYLYIFYFVFINGLKSHNECMLNPWGLPETVHFENYRFLLKEFLVYEGMPYQHNFWQMLFNSLMFSIPGNVMNLLFTSMAAYVTSKYRFKGASFFYALTLFIMMFPIYSTSGASYKLAFKLGNINSYRVILFAWGGFNSAYLYMYATFKGVSSTYMEAAKIDGANDYVIFFKIMLPQIIGLLVSLFIIGWIGEWNSYSGILVTQKKLPTLAGGIYLFQSETNSTVRQHILYAAYFLVSIPPLVLFASFNKLLSTSVSIGGIKE